MAISIRLPEADEADIRAYVNSNGMTVSEFARRSMLEKIEEESDIASILEYEKAQEKGTLKLRPAEDLWKELDL